MKNKSLLLVTIIMLGLAMSFGCTSNDNSEQTAKNNTEAGSLPSSSTSSNEATPVTSESTTEVNYDGSIPVVGTYYKCGNWSNEQYPLIRLFGEDYVPLYSNNEKIWNAHVDKLAKLLLDLPSEGEKYSLKTGETLDLENGYGIRAMQITGKLDRDQNGHARVVPLEDIDRNLVWLELDKDGQIVSEGIISVDGNNNTWTCKLDNIQGENNVAVFKVHVSKVAYFETYSVVQIDGIWLIDYANIKTLKIGDKFGEFTLTKINNGEDTSNLGSLIFEHNI